MYMMEKDMGRRVERIGKKYQWIAYYELLARLADNLDLDDFSLDRGESLIAPLQATWQVGARDIEPTIIDLDTKRAEKRFSSPSWIENEEQFSDESNVAWVKGDEDIPSIKILKSNQEWLYLYAFTNYSNYRGSYPAEEPYRDFWWRISSVIVKKDDIEKLIEEFSNKGLQSPYILGGLPERTNESFLKELMFHPDAQRGREKTTLTLGDDNVCVIHPVSFWTWESAMDISLSQESLHATIPERFSRNALNLKEIKLDGGFVIGFNHNDEMVYQATSSYLVEASNRESWACVRTDVFRESLEKKGLSLFWVLGGEKLIMNSGGVDARKTFSNLAYLSNSNNALCIGTSYDLFESSSD